LHFFATSNCSLSHQSSAAKRRDFYLLSQRRQVLLKNSFQNLSQHSATFSSPPGSFDPPRQPHPPPLPAAVVISEAHDCSTEFLALGRLQPKLV
jgi:hypothetical protein